MLGVAILGVAAVASSGRLGEMPAPVTSTPVPHLPQGDLTGDDLRAARFSVVPRGYSMHQVDELLDRLARQLDSGSSARGAFVPSLSTEHGAQTRSEGAADGPVAAPREDGTGAEPAGPRSFAAGEKDAEAAD